MSPQEAFRAALLDAAKPTPEGLRGPGGGPAGKRFDVYRNNVARSLTEALAAAFPALRSLVGEAFFTAMAGVYLRRYPPRSPRLTLYGAEMPVFLEGFEPAAGLRYLPDVARLEIAQRQSYHAADATPADFARLRALPTDRLMAARLGPAPALRLVRSPWPVLQIWRAALDGGPTPVGGAEAVLITRPAFDPVMTALGPGGGGFVAALIAGRGLGDAVAAGNEAPGFDLTATLGALIAGGGIVSVTEAARRRGRGAKKFPAGATAR